MKTITYAIDGRGRVCSRVGDELAIAVLDYDAIGMGGDGFMPGDFSGPIHYNLEKHPISSLHSEDWALLEWTKKVPVEIKNKHRAFWGMPLLREVHNEVSRQA